MTITVVSVRFSAPKGGLRYRLAEVVSERPALEAPIRVRFFDDGKHANVHPLSIVWRVPGVEVTLV